MTIQAPTHGVQLSFYTHVRSKHQGKLLYEWLLEEARRSGIHGGSTFRAIAGYGRHGVMREEHFFDLTGDLTAKVEFLVTTAQAEALLERVHEQQVDVFYASTPVSFGLLGTT